MVQPTTGHVFVSYSRKDEAVMRRIVKHLRAQGIKVWVDNEKLIPGTPVWEYEIEKAIKGASAIVVVLSPEAKKSEWVLREITLADQYQKRAFPILVDGRNEDSIPFRLITRQYVDIRTDESTGLNALSSAISFYLEELSRLQEERQAAEREIERLKQERETAEKAAREAEEKAEAERKAREEADRIAKLKKAEEKRIANAKLEENGFAKVKPTQRTDNKQSPVSLALKKLVSSKKFNKNILTGFLILATFIAFLVISQYIEKQNAINTAAADATNTEKAESTITADAKSTKTAVA
ncbi:MAG: toll/interleukin-1 receptor domain-containing protein, partial [Anaerolineales bacterium]|nr:toll/interleukin-1 receptor domain-containing protein [Anaerolineales bacterium]